jgi:hypothetical protein
MNTEDQTAFIVHRLTEGDDPKNIVFELCQQFNISWPQAQALVQQVQEEKHGEVSRRQFPLMFALALGIFIIGLGLIGYSIFTVWMEMPVLEASRAGAQTIEQNMDAAGFMYYFFLWIFRYGYQIIAMFILGIGMVIGSLLGMRDTWAGILENIKGL